ncbi:MAG: terminase gpP N-terminus-related DNA-binding protein [Clostridium sp.]|uniref:terminase gpP N-terminus-related DNA-binding protein n=1 Tax=Clostridium sp. TaxID=1506 RepID=UPI003EE7770A
MDVKDKAKKMWERAGGNNAEKGTLNNIAEKLGVTAAVIRSWKSRYNWGDNAPKIPKVTNRNKKKEQAKAMIVSGDSIKEVSEKTGIPEGTLYVWSSKYELQEKRLRNLLKFKEDNISIIMENKRRRLQAVTKATFILSEIVDRHTDDNGELYIPGKFLDDLKKTQEIEDMILGIDRVDDIINKSIINDINLKKHEMDKQKLNLSTKEKLEEWLLSLNEEQINELLEKMNNGK